VRTLFGRMRPIPDIESRNPNQRGFAERTAVNTPCRDRADLIKLAMIAIDRELTQAQAQDTHVYRYTTSCFSRFRRRRPRRLPRW